MPIPQNKQELIDAIEDAYSKLKKDLDTIPVNLTKQLELPGHAKDTLMSVNNLVAYLIGWGELVLKWNQLIKERKPVDFPDTGFKWTELGLLAQRFYKDYEKDDYPLLLEKLDTVVHQILSLIASSSNEEIYDQVWYKTYSMGRMIQLNTSSPYKNARTRIRKWKKGKGI